MGVLDYSTSAGSNTSLSGIGIQGSNKVSNFDNALRQFMADIASGVTRPVTKSSGPLTAVAGDHMQLWRCTATLTINLTAAATLTSGWQLIVFANGGTVTIDPNSSETINGAATLTVSDGSYAVIVCDGTGFYALAAPDLSVYVPLSLLTTRGDLPYRGASTWQRLAKGTAGQVLTQGADDPAWAADLLTSTLTTRGDIVYRDASAPARLAKGTSGQVLTMGADDPAWSDLPANDIVAALSSDFTTTSGTAANITDLTITLATGTYLIEYMMAVQMSASSTSATFSLLVDQNGGTATASTVAGQSSAWLAGGSGGNISGRSSLTALSSEASAAVGSGVVAAEGVYIITERVVVSGAGTLIPRGRLSATGLSRTAVIRAGSFIRARKLA